MTDHPRSRGVYAAAYGDGDGHSGSSPLARGLLPGAHDPGAPDGIIPARAGFTGRRATASTPPWDHPRSRGVYLERLRPPPLRGGDHPRSRGVYEGVWALPDYLPGSSPLARGLLPRE